MSKSRLQASGAGAWRCHGGSRDEALTWSDGTRHLGPGGTSSFDCGISGLESY